jgi:hypothetical protein
LANRNINSKISQRGKIQELLIRSYKDEWNYYMRPQ